MKDKSEPAEEICSCRLMARPLGFQPGNRSSILRRSTKMEPGVVAGMILAIVIQLIFVLPILFMQ